MNRKYGALLVSRNNAAMIEEWAKTNPTDELCVLNLDESTDRDSRETCERACSANNMNYAQARPGGLIENLRQAAEFFAQRGIEWILYMHHDAYPERLSSLAQLDRLVAQDALSEFGVIGFNIIHGHQEILRHQVGSQNLHTLARAPLELGDGWYRPLPSSTLNYKRVKPLPFAVESVLWSTALISCDVIQNDLVSDPRFVFFHAWDDIAFQLMMVGRYNITIPNVTFMHNQMLKAQYGLPVNSPIQSVGASVEDYYGRSDHLASWLEKWKFRWDFRKYVYERYTPSALRRPLHRLHGRIGRDLGIDPLKSLETISRRDFGVVRHHYEGTILDQFYKHNPRFGPLKYFPQLEVADVL